MECEIIQEKCIACGLCQVTAPHFFDYDREGLVIFKDEEINLRKKSFDEDDQKIIAAIKKCPTAALIAGR
ncbi:ferredoxin [Enterococcus timonensis]|uniref:ferredoxin n=1 Tax=Enterococcus timonensis TaxID=1852364 RepID=UPI0008DB0F7A|nr:ferredoxin [Enterococcus timonensis]